jgi:hypothetical protein
MNLDPAVWLATVMKVYYVGSSNECSSLHDMSSAELPSGKSGGDQASRMSMGNPVTWLISPNQSLDKIKDLFRVLTQSARNSLCWVGPKRPVYSYIPENKCFNL